MFGDDESPRAPLYERMSIELLGAAEGAAHGGGAGIGLTLHTTRGDVACVFHRPAEERGVGVVWAAGARGGFDGPADGMHGRLAERLAGRGVASLRVNYRRPGNLDESTLDVLVGVWRMANAGYPRVALVGHSFGGGVALSASRYTSHARGAAVLASQTAGAEEAALLGGRPLLVVHGEADAILPVSNAEAIYGWAPEPKRLVTYPGAGHGLRECAAELEELLEAWVCETLGIGAP